MTAVVATVCSSIKKMINVEMEMEIIEWAWGVSWQMPFRPFPTVFFFLLGEEDAMAGAATAML